MAITADMRSRRTGMEKILVIDDSAVAQALLGEIFGDAYELEFRGDGEGGFLAAQQLRPDLILLDINMPGLDGFQVCRMLKGDGGTSDIPVIFVSSVDAGDDRVKGFRAGGDDYVVKPFYPPELQARVSAHLGARRARAQALKLERLAVVQELAVAVSHEINNPLTSVFACIHLLQNESTPTSEPTRLYLDTLYEELRRIRDIVGRLASVTKASSTRYNAEINMIDLHDI